MNKVSEKIRRRANDAFNRRDYKEAELLFKRILSLRPRDYAALLGLSALYNEVGRVDELYALASDLYKDHPNDVAVLNRMGVALFRTGKKADGYELLKKAAELEPGRYETYLNLSSVAGEVNDIRGGMLYALEAVRVAPGSPSAHNNLGSALMAAGKPDEAKYCFETALELDPNNVFALTNLAVLATKGGDHARAAIEYEKCLELHLDPIEKNKLRFFLGLSYLTLGNLEYGWKNYDHGFIPEATHARNPVRRFTVPQWAGDNIEGKTLLVWREQGLGDEMLFFSCLKDLQGTGIKVIVECDYRLVSILRRSFPDYLVRPQSYFDAPDMGSPFSDFDFHIPAGSLMGVFRRKIEDFSKSGPYLVPEKSLVELYDTRLGPRDGKLRVGICWRSGDLSAIRNKSYTALSEWEPILILKNIQLVNLQYGDCEKELAAVSEHLGVYINRWPDLNLKDDLDETAALIKTLDLVISVGTATAQLAAAVGAETYLLTYKPTWTTFGCDYNPVYPNVKNLAVPVDDHIRSLIPLVAEALATDEVV